MFVVTARQRKTETFSTAAESKRETASSVYVYDLVSTYTYGSGYPFFEQICQIVFK